jgi:hypothetical protein
MGMDERESAAGAGQRAEVLDAQARAHEEQTAEHLAVVRDAHEQWESYGHVMREHARRIEEASVGDDAKNYFVQRRLAVRRELDGFVSQVVRQQAELLDEAAREVRAESDEMLDRVAREKASASWA